MTRGTVTASVWGTVQKWKWLLRWLLLISVVNCGVVFCKEHNYLSSGRELWMPRDKGTNSSLAQSDSRMATGGRSLLDTLCILILKALELTCLCAMFLCLLLILLLCLPIFPLLIGAFFLSLLLAVSLVAFFGLVGPPPIPTLPPPPPADEDDFEVVTNRSFE